MKTQTVIMLVCLSFIGTCEKPTDAGLGHNLLTNGIFEWNGVPSLHGWVVSDTSGVEFSTDVPTGGTKRSITVHPSWFPTWPIGIIYQSIPAFVGTHRYAISVFGKKIGVSGGVGVSLNRPHSNQWKGWLSGITISDTSWTYYSSADTITAGVGDSIFIAILTGACEVCYGTTYFNTCVFMTLD